MIKPHFLRLIGLIGLALFAFSCSNLNMYEIKRLEKEVVEELKLEPAPNCNELRIDIIRNVTTYYNGSYTTTELVPYHKLGFDLGNGIFYDLNGNLCLLIEHIFGLSPKSEFLIEQNINPSTDRKKRLYAYKNDSLVKTNLFSEKSRLLYVKEKLGDTLMYSTEKGQRFSFVETDTSLTYRWRNRKPEKILEVDNGTYKINRPNARMEYKLSDEGIGLANTYFICQGQDSRSIEIRKSKKGKKGKLLMSIVKGKDSIFIYSKMARGTKIELRDNRLLVLKPGSKTITSYELK